MESEGGGLRKGACLKDQLNILIVSCRAENKKTLRHALDDLPVNAFYVSSIAEAVDQLSARPLAVVFCEEHLSDASYPDLLSLVRAYSPGSRFVVMLCTGEWEEYLEALRLGAAEVVRCPLQAPDIDMVLISAIREGYRDSALHASA
jgi:DNA-binding NtrC family response regulator